MAPSVHTTGAAAPAAQPASSGVLTIESMPAHLRSVVEDLMVSYLRSESTWEVSGQDPLEAQWCTRWYKDWPGHDLAALAAGRSAARHGVGCRQVITGTREELKALDEAVAALAQTHGFSAWVSM
ncbi:hypothetical protein CPHO_03750 [Corynebacterium phocae]|uniref:Uncharacterized protein n=1 Tax=Corynebacterium phocae TaxID=161895 RepID=A0A1L7D658_9CORY|nr:hypothetical protein CPHO_03750 [Corynebacterium phocae]